jgi:hypothetical protein
VLTDGCHLSQLASILQLQHWHLMEGHGGLEGGPISKTEALVLQVGSAGSNTQCIDTYSVSHAPSKSIRPSMCVLHCLLVFRLCLVWPSLLLYSCQLLCLNSIIIKGYAFVEAI